MTIQRMFYTRCRIFTQSAGQPHWGRLSRKYCLRFACTFSCASCAGNRTNKQRRNLPCLISTSRRHWGMFLIR